MARMPTKKRLLTIVAGLGLILVLSLAVIPSHDDRTGPGGQAGLGDSLYPLLGNPGYDALHYEIEMDVSPAENAITATTLITAQATKNLEAFNLDLSGLEVRSLTVNNVPAPFSRQGHKLTINPAGALAAGSQFQVAVVYSGSPEPITDPGVPFSKLGWHHRAGIIYTLNQPSGAMTWFPSNNHPADKATYEMRITVPEGVVAAANGVLAGQTAAGGKTTYTWQMDRPMATYLAAIYIGDFERVSHGPLDGGSPLIRNYLPQNADPSISQALAVTPEIIRFFEARLGPYPFEAYGTMVMPFDLGFALENQTLSIHGPDTIGVDILAHEIAHQWLGNSATLDDWGDIWLNESFATYLQLMFEAQYFEQDLGSKISRVQTVLATSGAGPAKGIKVRDFVNFNVYGRGVVGLQALRRHAGDEVFFKILQAHYDQAAGSNTNTDKFLGIVNELAGPEAVDIVESWLLDETPGPL